MRLADDRSARIGLCGGQAAPQGRILLSASPFAEGCSAEPKSLRHNDAQHGPTTHFTPPHLMRRRLLAVVRPYFHTLFNDSVRSYHAFYASLTSTILSFGGQTALAEALPDWQQFRFSTNFSSVMFGASLAGC